ncbi:MAG: DegV family protein [Clostridia bacterium]|nr:DegV family protein [Clostridia bacterium]
MKSFEISVDSTCDLYAEELKNLGIYMAPLEYTMTSGDNVVVEKDNYECKQDYINFYDKLRSGVIAKTSILNVQSHIDLFTEMAKNGVKNALHISQGYGLSPTVDNANVAIESVKKDFPDINFVAVESGSTTIGEGFIVRAALKMRDEGKTLQETVNKLNEIKHFIQHFILANDLNFLARGGRIPKASAMIGSMLQVKPVIEFGKDGKLKVCRKEIGLKKALKSIVNDFENFTINEEFPFIAIVHTDNEPLANELQTMLFEKYGIKPEIRIMGPIIGAHVGPNSVAYGFISNEQRPYE